jgi:lactate dehydrogenase-like 2-hydroxyacid dehydrogenase
LEKQYEENPELFLNKKCYTHIATDDTPNQLLMNRIEGAEVVISCWTNIPDEILYGNPQLKFIVFWTHEKEHRINMKLADELGITIVNIPDYGTDSVTEVVFAGLYKILVRNFKEVSNEYSCAITEQVFEYFRKLSENESKTRVGKFTHQFHKIGKAKFDFSEKSLEELIPEKLVFGKSVGFFKIDEPQARQFLETFGVKISQILPDNIDNFSNEFYRFFTTNEVIFFNSHTLNQKEIAKIQLLSIKSIDIKDFSGVNYDFRKKTFGIIGIGRIGKKVAITAKNLGFQVVCYSKTQNPKFEEESGVRYLPLEKLMSESDIVSLHVPAHHAENLIGRKLIETMKTGSIFINTADGNAVDQKALTERMVKKEVFAYLDVYPGLPRKDILGLPMTDKTDWKVKNTLSESIIAYRAGWKTQESIDVKTTKLLGELITFLNQ